jgi:hypothetical protein
VAGAFDLPGTARNESDHRNGIADLVAESVVTQAKYCLESSGDITLRLEFILHLKNTTPNAIVLPLFARLSRYEMFSADAALRRGQKERDVSFRAEDVLDPNKLDKTGPDPKLFRILKTGETSSLYTSVSIVLLPARAVNSPLLGKDHFLKLYVNPWPAERGVGDTLSRLWAQYGNLSLREIPSLPFKFHIEHQPSAEACHIRVD